MVFVLVFFTAFVESIECIFVIFVNGFYCTNRVILSFALQVQRRQARKHFVSPSNAPRTQELPSTVTPHRSTREEHPSLPSSATAALKEAERSVPDQEASLFRRLEAASADFEDISAKASKMEHVLAGIPIVEQIHHRPQLSRIFRICPGPESYVNCP